MAEATLPLDRFAVFTGRAPRVLNRKCACGHREADRHLLDWRGHRAACGATVPGYTRQVRCPCTRFTPAGGTR
jgi:hypothetical protein